MMNETAHEWMERVGRNYAFVTLTSCIFFYVHFSICKYRESPTTAPFPNRVLSALAKMQ